ncbi:hypothetical protein ACF0H5_016118 [Mactra antiquata]
MDLHCHLIEWLSLLFVAVCFVGGTPPHYPHPSPGYRPPYRGPEIFYGYASMGPSRGMMYDIPYRDYPGMPYGAFYGPSYGPLPIIHYYPPTLYPSFPPFGYEYTITPYDRHMFYKRHSEYKDRVSRYYGPSRSYGTDDLSSYRSNTDITRPISELHDNFGPGLDDDRDPVFLRGSEQGEFDLPHPSETHAESDTQEQRDPPPSRNRIPYRIHRQDETGSEHLPADTHPQTDIQRFGGLSPGESDAQINDTNSTDPPLPRPETNSNVNDTLTESNVNDTPTDSNANGIATNSDVNGIPIRNFGLLIPPLHGFGINAGTETADRGSVPNENASMSIRGPPESLVQSLLLLSTNPSRNHQDGGNVIAPHGHSSHVTRNEK